MEHTDLVLAVPDGFILEGNTLFLAKGDMKIGNGTDIGSFAGGVMAYDATIAVDIAGVGSAVNVELVQED